MPETHWRKTVSFWQNTSEPSFAFSLNRTEPKQKTLNGPAGLLPFMSSALLDLFVDSFWQILLPGLTVTVPLTILAFSGALVIAVIVALVQFARVPVLKDLARLYIWVTRGTPLLVQLFVVFYGLPHAGFLIDPFVAAVVVFAVNEGAYCAETIRAALESVPTGQLEVNCPHFARQIFNRSGVQAC